MAVVFFKSPCAGGNYYYFATPPGQTTTIPDAHLALLDPTSIIVIEETSDSPPEAPPIDNTLLRAHDWYRAASEGEIAEVIKLRSGGPGVANEKSRRSNVIAGTTV